MTRKGEPFEGLVEKAIAHSRDYCYLEYNVMIWSAELQQLPGRCDLELGGTGGGAQVQGWVL